jgi:CBS domain-containing protein
MTPDPKYCTATATAQEAARLMENENVGMIPIVDEALRRLLGVVTDRDLCLEVVAERRDSDEVLLAECMSMGPIACYAEDDLQKAEQLMKKHQIRRIPVLDEQHRLVGIIAQADVALRAEELEEVGSLGPGDLLAGRKTDGEGGLGAI